MHKMNRLLVAVVSWYHFKLTSLHRQIVIKTIKRTIKLTPTEEVEKQGTSAVATLQNIPINNNSNLHYLLVGVRLVLQKTNDITSVQNNFYYLYTSSPCVETSVLGKRYFFFFYTLKPRTRWTGVCALVS